MTKDVKLVHWKASVRSEKQHQLALGVLALKLSAIVLASILMEPKLSREKTSPTALTRRRGTPILEKNKGTTVTLQPTLGCIT
jgi:hypothetical protein